MRVVRSDLACPGSVGRAPVAEAAVGQLRILDEAKVDGPQPVEARTGTLANDGHERAGGIVGGVAVLAPRLPEASVLEEADVVGQRTEVREPRRPYPASARVRFTPPTSSR